MQNPALSAFVASLTVETIFGQVWIHRLERGFELRHVADRETDPADLRQLGENDIRPLAQFAAGGAFRPLKSAPNLQSGWRAVVADEELLGAALDKLYPGAVADWFAARTPPAPMTSYRDFTARQTGMYRITTHLDDTTAGAVIRTCCHKDFCLKRRLWTVARLAPDPAVDKSIIPCLEPCAILLEFARKIARLEQGDRIEPPPVLADVEVAETDFDAPNNPRRLRFVLEKQSAPGTQASG